MARIRSIKPEFWSDAKIADLPKATALFFIALWNFADDQGIIEDDSRSLALRIPMYRSQDIEKMLNALWRVGLIKRSSGCHQCLIAGSTQCQRYSNDAPSQGGKGGLDHRSGCDGLVLVTGWAHQKIDKPRDGKWKGQDIEWITYSGAEKPRESSANVRRKDRIGSDGSGSDRIVPTGSKEPAGTEGKSISSQVWDAYSEAYREKYGVEPLRNATVNSQIKHFVGRVPASEAPAIAAFYLTHSDYYYVKNRHPVGAMLKDAEKLRTEWATGNRSTTAAARSADQMQGVQSQMERVLRGEL